jgi:hypothetical protein
MQNLPTKFATALVSILLGLTLLPAVSAAQILTPQDLQARIVLDPNLKPENSPGVVVNPETLKSAGAETAFANYMLQVLAGGLITVAAPVAVIIIAISGLFAVVSHGDQKLIVRAKKTLTWAVIGLIVIIFAWVIVRTTIEVVLSVNNAPGSPAGQSAAPAAGGASTSPGGSTDKAP